MKTIRSLIHKNDPYEKFSALRGTDLHGWGGHPELFNKLVDQVNPSTIVEVGSWKGKSATTFAKRVQERKLDCEVVCVDTWLGATEFWTNHEDKTRYESLELVHGYPSVYYQFLSNMKTEGFQDIVTPFPQTSVNAARFFSQHNLKAQLIYIDASHDFQDVIQDISSWWEILDSGGIMFGDDFCDYWSGVKDAVEMFTENLDLTFEVVSLANEPCRPYSDYWIMSPKK